MKPPFSRHVLVLVLHNQVNEVKVAPPAVSMNFELHYYHAYWVWSIKVGIVCGTPVYHLDLCFRNIGGGGGGACICLRSAWAHWLAFVVVADIFTF